MRLTVLVAIIGLAVGPTAALAQDPDCTGLDRYPASMAFVHLKNAGVTSNEKIDFSKTAVTRVASERIGGDLYRQVHLVRFTEHTGATLEVITVSDASRQECSMGGVEVYVISRRLGGR